MIVVDIITWAFEAYLVTLAGMWVYAVLWMLCSIVRGE